MNPHIESLEPTLLLYGTHSNRVKSDVAALMSQFPALLPAPKEYVSNDGSSSTVICLEGTIPIVYKGVTYNIPITCWVISQYPNQPPVCYVSPVAARMAIKPSHRHVDSNGLVYHPYLTSWHASRSNLVEFIKTLVAVFSAEPPVYSISSSTCRNSHPPTPSASTHPTRTQSSPHISSSTMPSPAPTPVSSTLSEVERNKLQLTIKLKEQLEAFNRQMTADIDQFLKLQQRLTAGGEQIKQIIERLTQHKLQLKQNLEILAAKEVEVEQWLEANADSIFKLSIDEILQPADQLSAQIFDAVAEDAAIEDVIYTLDKALANGTINLATYMKHVRKLAQDQFTARVRIRKIIELHTAGASVAGGPQPMTM